MVINIPPPPLSKLFNFTTQSGPLTTRKKTLENTVGKEENAGKQHFLLFPQCFLSQSRRQIILATFYMLFANAFRSGLKFCCLVKGEKKEILIVVKNFGILAERVMFYVFSKFLQVYG